MTDQTDRLLRHIAACTGAILPGGRVRLHIGAAAVGWVSPAHAPPAPLADGNQFAAYVAALRTAGAYAHRGEAFDVRCDGTGRVVATVDRGALPVLGIAAHGVHANGLVMRAGVLHLWVGTRAADKRLDPGKQDHLVAGGIAAGDDPASTLAKEGREEAGLADALARVAIATGQLSYAAERAEGLRRDTLHCYDLHLPEDFVPRPCDGEVAEFRLLPATEVLRLLVQTDDFKFNVALVLIDLFLRRGLIAPGGAVEQAIRPLRMAAK